MYRDEWLQTRTRGIGGSDVAAILGLSPWRTPYDVAASKNIKGQPPTAPDLEHNAAMTRGIYLEPAVAEWYADDTGYTVTDPGSYRIEVGPHPWMLGTPDRYVSNKGHHWGLEIKTSKRAMGWGPSGTDEVPEHVALQCLWYMACTGLYRWDVAVFFTFTDDFRRYTMRRDRELESGIISRVGKWWQRHIVDGEPVQLDHSESAASFLADTYPEQREPLRDATEVEADLVCRAIDLREKEKEISRARKALEAQLKERIGDAEGFRLDSVKATWKSQSRTRIDTRRMKAEHPDLCKKYEVESSSRILRMVAS